MISVFSNIHGGCDGFDDEDDEPTVPPGDEVSVGLEHEVRDTAVIFITAVPERQLQSNNNEAK